VEQWIHPVRVKPSVESTKHDETNEPRTSSSQEPEPMYLIPIVLATLITTPLLLERLERKISAGPKSSRV